MIFEVTIKVQTFMFLFFFFKSTLFMYVKKLRLLNLKGMTDHKHIE